jgi:hypothetical protein
LVLAAFSRAGKAALERKREGELTGMAVEGLARPRHPSAIYARTFWAFKPRCGHAAVAAAAAAAAAHAVLQAHAVERVITELNTSHQDRRSTSSESSPDFINIKGTIGIVKRLG